MRHDSCQTFTIVITYDSQEALSWSASALPLRTLLWILVFDQIDFGPFLYALVSLMINIVFEKVFQYWSLLNLEILDNEFLKCLFSFLLRTQNPNWLSIQYYQCTSPKKLWKYLQEQFDQDRAYQWKIIHHLKHFCWCAYFGMEIGIVILDQVFKYDRESYCFCISKLIWVMKIDVG